MKKITLGANNTNGQLKKYNAHTIPETINWCNVRQIYKFTINQVYIAKQINQCQIF